MEKASAGEDSLLYLDAERRTNRDNIICLFVLTIVLLLCDILNEIGIFKVVTQVMRIGTLCGMVFYSTPVIISAVYNKIHKKSGKVIESLKWFKYVVVGFSWLGTVAACIMLTHHTVIVMVVPIIIMAQYRNNKFLIPMTVLFSTICVLLGVYGGYFFGCFDANLLHVGITPENEFDLVFRAEMATPTRMMELLTHYALPRELVVLSLIFLSSRISKRSDAMLVKQIQLQSEVKQEMQKTNDIQWQIIDSMANLIENRDSDTGEHVKRTGRYVEEIARELEKDHKLSKDEITTIKKAAPLHDIGKIMVTDSILQKPGRLTSGEYNEIKRHAAEGARVIRNVLGNVEDEKFLLVAEQIAECHHERWDGTGYPNGLKGTEIPLPARIMAVADVFDALVSKRVYKDPIPVEDAFEIIKSESGKQFDPLVVDVFLRIKPLITEIAK